VIVAITATTKIVIEAGEKSCFSSDLFRVELKGSDREHVDVYLTAHGTCDHFALLPSQAQGFLKAVFEAATKPEVLAGGRSTTYYEASIEWRDFGNKSGNLTFISNDEGPVLASLVLDSPLKAEALEISERLPRDMHCRPFEIYKLCEAFQRELAPAR